MPSKPKRRVCLKFGPEFPIRLMNAMQEFGFSLYARKSGHDGYTIFEKVYDPDEEVDETGLTEDMKKHLESRMRKVVDIYLNPYENIPAIKIQCERIANSLENEFEREFVLNWIKDTLEADDFTPPWEDKDDDRFDPKQPEFGFC